jgi:alanine-synthesizing transaminase
VLSRRLDFDAAENALTRLLAEKRRAGARIVDLTESNPTRVGLRYPEAWADALAGPGAKIYEPTPRGLPAAREAVAAYYAGRGVAVDPEAIVLTASTSEAYSLLCKLLCDPHDALLAPRPGYPLLDPIAALEGVRLDRYPLRPGTWRIDADALAARVDARTRAVVVVNPNNPTGSYLKRTELEALCDLAARRDLALISDEVFADYPLIADAERVDVAAAQSRVPCFSLGGLSKICALPQVKVGWIVLGGPPDSRRRILGALEHIADTYLSCSGPAQHALPELLALRHTVGAQIAARVRENYAWLSASGADVLPAEGGWYAVLRLPSPLLDEALALDLLARDDVLVHPGYFYDFEEPCFVVVSLLCEPPTLHEGIGRLLDRTGHRAGSEFS